MIIFKNSQKNRILESTPTCIKTSTSLKTLSKIYKILTMFNFFKFYYLTKFGLILYNVFDFRKLYVFLIGVSYE